MSDALFLAAIIGPAYLIMGLSFLLYNNQWRKLFGSFEKNHFNFFGVILLELVLGLVVVNMYNVWAWDLFLIITLTGWGMLLESTFYMLAPESAIKSLFRMKTMKSDGLMYTVGAVLLVLGLLLSHAAYYA